MSSPSASTDNAYGWDAPGTHFQLVALVAKRAVFRIGRLFQRLRSPRRLLATSLAVLFFGFYVLNGIFVLSARQPADPARLQLWLSGGMVIYAMYHMVRCVWSRKLPDLELTEAETVWLGGAPIRRSSLALYHVNTVFISSLIKAFLLSVVLMFDVTHVEFLLLGVLTSLILLESLRVVLQRWSAGLCDKRRTQMRIAATAVIVALALQVIARVFVVTPYNAPPHKFFFNALTALGQTASCEAVQWLSLPWYASSHLAVAKGYSLLTCFLLLASILMVPAVSVLLVYADRWANQQRHLRQRERLASGKFSRNGAVPVEAMQWTGLPKTSFSRASDTAGALIARQGVGVRRYAGTILFSFVIPTLLCLSPLVTGQVTERWFYVVGGIAMCTVLLAPPALKIDFRRDLKRMLLLRSLPVRPFSMVIGQLYLPICITLTFQWVTMLIAAVFAWPGLSQFVLWAGMLNALAVFTFATENALFLAYPHHEHSEGVAMMIRTKLTFLGKGAVLAGSLAALAAWAIFCKAVFSGVWVKLMLLTGAIATTWMIAAIALYAAAWCWKRFDLAYDVPPA